MSLGLLFPGIDIFASEQSAISSVSALLGVIACLQGAEKVILK